MTHEQALPLVSDWVLGRLESGRRHDVEAHVRVCHECQQAADAARRLAGEATLLADAPQGHPSADALARYVSEPDAESVSALARVGAHLRGCETCREDVALMREASRPAWTRAIRAGWHAPGASERVLQSALALAVLLLVFPAWRGLVELPRERAAAEQRLRSADEARARAESAARERAARPAPAGPGGGIAALVLQGTARGTSAPPTLRLRSGQPFQPVLLDVTPPAGALAITLARGDTVVWTASGSREEFWDDANRFVGLLVPADALVPGGYTVEVRRDGSGALVFTSGFKTVAGSSGAGPRSAPRR